MRKRKDARPVFCECGCCGCYHPKEWYGDCRDDSQRLCLDEIEAKFGPLNFDIIPLAVEDGNEGS